MTIERVAVIGCGLMGSGIAQVCATAGYSTQVVEVSDELLEMGVSRIRKSIDAAVDRGKLDPGKAEDVMGRISPSTDLATIATADLVIEAVTEDKEVKKELLRKIGEVASANATLASNTSSICITELAAAAGRGSRFVGLHFFNPVPAMKLVELIRTLEVEEETVQAVKSFAESLGKTVIVAKDTTGFVVNRLLVPFLLEAIRLVESGVAAPEDIDQAMKLGCGHPMGPIELLDFVGLDTTESIAEVFFDDYRERLFAPPAMLRRLVHAGRLGRKSGRGFYDYGQKK